MSDKPEVVGQTAADFFRLRQYLEEAGYPDDDDAICTLNTLSARVAELEGENARLREDAERYRWLRVNTELIDCEYWLPTVSAIDFKPGPEFNSQHETLDAAIDAAMRQGKGESVADTPAKEGR